MLNVHGRELGMGFGTLRIEAITQLLQVYNRFDQFIFERIMKIETKMFQFLANEERERSEKSRKLEEQKRKVSQNRTR